MIVRSSMRSPLRHAISWIGFCKKNPRKRATATESLRHTWIQKSCTVSESEIPVIQRKDLSALTHEVELDNCSPILTGVNNSNDVSRKSSAIIVCTERENGEIPMLNGISPNLSGSSTLSRRESATRSDLPVVFEVNGMTSVAPALKPTQCNSQEEEKSLPIEDAKVPAEEKIPVYRTPRKEVATENIISQMENAHINSIGQQRSEKPAESLPPPPLTVKTNGVGPNISAPRAPLLLNGSIHSRHLGGVSLLERAAKWIEAKNQSLDAYTRRLPSFRPSAPSKVNAFIAARSSFVTASGIAERRMAFTKETTVSGFRWRMVGDSGNTATRKSGNAAT
uniref:Uncharacterized protein n=2 Tax=Schistocephalus solidus TaxID=70667 RepID=A0A0X3P6A3_SCHSO